MNTPVADFVQRYAKAGTARLHMPGHKGRCFFGLRALGHHGNPRGGRPLRGGGHPSGERTKRRRPVWLPADLLLHRGLQPVHPGHAVPGGGSQRLPHCGGGEERPPGLCLRRRLAGFGNPLAVAGGKPLFVRVPHLPRPAGGDPEQPAGASGGGVPHQPGLSGRHGGNPALAQVCHQHGTLLLVDNAHGAYLRFLQPSLHPLDLGADLCCDSAHKTLPVLTGGAYLHLSPAAPAWLAAMAKSALGLFGSTSPSYLTLASLDLCNRYLAEGYPQRLAETVGRLEGLREKLAAAGWQVESSDPLRVTVAAPSEVDRPEAGPAAAAPRRGVRVRRPGLPGADGHSGKHPGGTGPGGRGLGHMSGPAKAPAAALGPRGTGLFHPSGSLLLS